MPRLNAANNARTVLAEAITSDATSFTVADAAAFPAPPFRVTVENEIMEIGAKDDQLNTFSSVQRGLEGTAAASHPEGATVENRLTAGTYAELAGEQEFNAHLADITAHGRPLTYLTYYVDADTGNDNNPGTSNAPFRTIKKAIDSIPVGAVGRVWLLGSTTFTINTPIYIYNKVVVLEGLNDYKTIHITSSIYLIDSTFSMSTLYIYAEVSPGIFICSGIVGIKCGGYYYVTVRPLNETSNVNFIRVNAIADANFFTRPVAIYLIGDRLQFRTDNYPSYSGTFNVFAKNPAYTFPVVFTRWWQMTKDANVNWGATEYQLGSSGTSLWYF